MDDNYLYIFLHIPRTAGTTFVNHIERFIPKNKRLRLYIDTLKYVKGKKPVFYYNDYQEIVEGYIDKNLKGDIADIKVLYGHIIPYGIHKYFKRKPRYFTFIRDPVKRVISLYNFWSTSYKTDSDEGKKNSHYNYSFLVDSKQPSFKDWVEAKIKDNNYATHSMLLSRYFHSLGYMNNPENIDSLIKIFNNFFFIGETENFSDDSLYMFNKLGINRYLFNRNISQKYIPSSVGRDLNNYLTKIYKKDIKIYNELKNISKSKKMLLVDYSVVVKKQRLKRYIISPITKLLIDTKFMLRQTSFRLKKKFLLYEKLIKFIKSALGIKKFFN